MPAEHYSNMFQAPPKIASWPMYYPPREEDHSVKLMYPMHGGNKAPASVVSASPAAANSGPALPTQYAYALSSSNVMQVPRTVASRHHNVSPSSMYATLDRDGYHSGHLQPVGAANGGSAARSVTPTVPLASGVSQQAQPQQAQPQPQPHMAQMAHMSQMNYGAPTMPMTNIGAGVYTGLNTYAGGLSNPAMPAQGAPVMAGPGERLLPLYSPLPGSKPELQEYPAFTNPPVACAVCGKEFAKAYSLKSHMRTHSSDRPYKCQFCPKTFARSHDRKRHENLHGGEKNYRCEGFLRDGVTRWGCGKTFARSDALSRHFRTETGFLCIKRFMDEERDRVRAAKAHVPVTSLREPRLYESMTYLQHAQPILLPPLLRH